MSERIYIDRYGKLHSASVFRHWDERIIKLFEIRLATPAELEGRE